MLDRSATASFPLANLRALSAGGLEHSPRKMLSSLQEVGATNLPLARAFEGHLNALLLIARFGTAQQIEQARRQVLEGRCTFGVWNTGPAGLPQLEHNGTGGYQLRGGKTFCTGAGSLDAAIVTAASETGWQMIVLPVQSLEGRVDRDSWHPFGMEATESFNVDFSGLAVHADALLGGPEDYYREPDFSAGAIRFSTIQVGTATALVHETAAFIQRSSRSDDPHQQARMGRMAIAVENGRHWVQSAAGWLENAHAGDDCLRIRAHMMRCAVEQICMEVMELVEISVGARGLNGDPPFARMLRDLRMYLRQAGADHALTAVGRARLEQELTT